LLQRRLTNWQVGRHGDGSRQATTNTDNGLRLNAVEQHSGQLVSYLMYPLSQSSAYHRSPAT